MSLGAASTGVWLSSLYKNRFESLMILCNDLCLVYPAMYYLIPILHDFLILISRL